MFDEIDASETGCPVEESVMVPEIDPPEKSNGCKATGSYLTFPNSMSS